MCLCHLSSKYVYHPSSGGIFQGFGFRILLHDVFTPRLCCEDFFNQLKWKQNIQSEMQKCLNHIYYGEIISEKYSPLNRTKSRLNLTMSTNLFCIIVYVAWPFGLTSFGSGCFFRWITHREVQNDSIIRCC